MAKLTELIMQMQKYFDQFGDVQVVFKHPDNNVSDILSAGMSKALNIKDQEIVVCWLAGEFVNDDSNPDAKQTSFPSD